MYLYVERNIEVRSCNHCCSGKEINITYTECVFVALVTQHDRLRSRNACYHSVHNILSSMLLSKNLKIKIYRTKILPVVLYGCETWSLTPHPILCG